MSIEMPKIDPNAFKQIDIDLPVISQSGLENLEDLILWPPTTFDSAMQRIGRVSRIYIPEFAEHRAGKLFRTQNIDDPYCFDCEGGTDKGWRRMISHNELDRLSAADVVPIVDLSVNNNANLFEYAVEHLGLANARFKFYPIRTERRVLPTGLCVFGQEPNIAYVVSPVVVGMTQNSKNEQSWVFDLTRYARRTWEDHTPRLNGFSFLIRKSKLREEEVRQIFPDQATDEIFGATPE